MINIHNDLALTTYPGGKTKQKANLNRIFGLVAPLCSYFVDGFAGAGSVSLNQLHFKPEKVIINELDVPTYSMWSAFHSVNEFNLLKNMLLPTTYCEGNFTSALSVFNNIKNITYTDDVLAWATILAHRFSRNSQCKDFSWSNRIRGGRPECVNAWENYKLKLDVMHEKVKQFTIHQLDIIELLQKYNDEVYLIYLDPPYMPETRCKKLYRTEMTVKQHSEMLDTLNGHKAKIVISGRPSNLYSIKLSNWNCESEMILNQMSQTKTKPKKVECIWRNF